MPKQIKAQEEPKYPTLRRPDSIQTAANTAAPAGGLSQEELDQLKESCQGSPAASILVSPRTPDESEGSCQLDDSCRSSPSSIEATFEPFTFATPDDFSESAPTPGSRKERGRRRPSCVDRWPEPGDRVLRADGRAVTTDGGWRLEAQDVAVVEAIDDDGDFRLRAPNGQVSGFLFRKHYVYCQEAVEEPAPGSPSLYTPVLASGATKPPVPRTTPDVLAKPREQEEFATGSQLVALPRQQREALAEETSAGVPFLREALAELLEPMRAELSELRGAGPRAMDGFKARMDDLAIQVDAYRSAVGDVVGHVDGLDASSQSLEARGMQLEERMSALHAKLDTTLQTVSGKVAATLDTAVNTALQTVTARLEALESMAGATAGTAKGCAEELAVVSDQVAAIRDQGGNFEDRVSAALQSYADLASRLKAAETAREKDVRELTAQVAVIRVAVIRDQAHIQKPGLYQIIHDEGVPVTRDISRRSAQIGKVAKGTQVEVIQIVGALEDGRVRGRIKSPEGWISLCHESQTLYATMQQDLGHLAGYMAEDRTGSPTHSGGDLDFESRLAAAERSLSEVKAQQPGLLSRLVTTEATVRRSVEMGNMQGKALESVVSEVQFLRDKAMAQAAAPVSDVNGAAAEDTASGAPLSDMWRDELDRLSNGVAAARSQSQELRSQLSVALENIASLDRRVAVAEEVHSTPSQVGGRPSQAPTAAPSPSEQEGQSLQELLGHIREDQQDQHRAFNSRLVLVESGLGAEARAAEERHSALNRRLEAAESSLGDVQAQYPNVLSRLVAAEENLKVETVRIKAIDEIVVKHDAVCSRLDLREQERRCDGEASPDSLNEQVRSKETTASAKEQSPVKQEVRPKTVAAEAASALQDEGVLQNEHELEKVEAEATQRRAAETAVERKNVVVKSTRLAATPAATPAYAPVNGEKQDKLGRCRFGFPGRYRTSDRMIATIPDDCSRLHWSCGTSMPIVVRDGCIEMRFYGQLCRGNLDTENGAIRWSDGDVWPREGSPPLADTEKPSPAGILSPLPLTRRVELPPRTYFEDSASSTTSPSQSRSPTSRSPAAVLSRRL